MNEAVSTFYFFADFMWSAVKDPIETVLLTGGPLLAERVTGADAIVSGAKYMASKHDVGVQSGESSHDGDDSDIVGVVAGAEGS